MKRILAWVLTLVLVLGLFAGCKQQEEAPATTQPAQQDEVITANDAMAYLKALYPKSEEAMKTPVNFERPGIIRVGGIPFTIVWSTDLPEEQIKIVVSEDGATVTIDVNEQCEADTAYVLTATITDEQGNTASTTWDCLLPEAIDMVGLVKEAYALKAGESLPYEATLRGKIINIDTAWNPEYQNITVTIAVEGAEDMPIECYRLKGEGADKLQVGNIITVTGTLKNYQGTIEFDAGCVLDAVEQGDAVEALTDVGEILKAAYKLKDGKSLGYSVELTGKVTEIDTPYDPGYKNISVVIEVEGYSKYPILCYRLKGGDVDAIAVDDVITVTGLIKNYKGTIEFDAGCQMIKRVSGGGVAAKPSSDAKKILADAKKLKSGEKLDYYATLTGEVVSLDDPYSSQYKNVTVTIEVNGVKIQCYRMKGDDASKVRVTDKITVTGQIENYNGKLEFGAGCTLDSWTKGSRKVTVDYGPLSENTAYKMEMKLPPLGKNVYFNGKISSSNYLQTGTYAEGVEVFMEKHTGDGVRFYFMNNDVKTYIEIFINSEDKARPTLKTEPSVYWNYDEDTGVYTVSIDWVKYYLGTYTNSTSGTTPDSASASKISYLTSSTKGKTQFYFDFVTEPSEAPDAPENPDTPVVPGTPTVAVTELKTGDQVVIFAPAYNKALSTQPAKEGSYYQKGVNVTLSNGVLSGYGATETWTVTVNPDGTYSFANGGKNIAMGASYSSMKLGEVNDDWKLDSLGGTLFSVKNVGRGNYMQWADSFGNYSTYNGDPETDSQYHLSFYVIDKGLYGVEGGDTPDTPDVPGAAVTELKTGDQVVIFAPAYNKALSTQPAQEGSYYQKGVDVTLSNGVLSGYGATETWTVTVNADGSYSFANGGENIAMGASYSSMKLGEVNDKWELGSLGGTLFSVKNAGRGNYMQWADSFGNYSTYNGDPAADKQFQLSFYVIDKGLYGVEGGNTPDTPDVPGAAVTELKTGDQVVIFAPAYNKALSTQPAQEGSYYQKGVDVTLSNGVLSGYGATETWTVTVNADGSYSFANGGENIAMGASYSSMKLGEVNDKWELGSLGGTLFSVKNAGRGNYMQWAENFGNYSTYNGDPATDKQFQLSFYVVDKGLYGVEGGNTPDTPDTPIVPDTPAAGTATKLTALPVDGDVIVIYNSNKAMGNTASGNKIAAVDGTVTGDSLALTDAMAQLKVVVEGNNYIFMLGDKYLTSGATGNSMSYADTLTDCGRWTIAAATEGTWYITNVGANYNGNYNQAMEYYNGFTTYGKRETAIYQMELYKVPEAPAGGQLLSALPADGDMIVIVNGTKAMGNAASGNKIAAVDAEIAENVLTLTDDMAQLKVVVEGNNYIFMLGDKYLTSGATGNSMSYADTLTDCGRWTIAAATEGTWYITNVGANYNGNYNQAMEYYNGFTTYGKRETAIYQMQMFKVGASGTTPEQPEQPPVNPPAGNELTIEEAIALGTPMAQDTFTTEKYKVTGVIDEIYNTQYGNMYIKDAAGNRLKIFGTWDATGATRYDALNVKPVVGDTVILLGVIGNFNGAQMKDGWIIEHLPAGNTPEQPENPPVNPDEPVGESATITFDDTAKRTSLSDNQQVWTENEITVTIDKGSSTSPINGQYFKPLRIYKNHVMTVAYPGIVKLEMDCNYSTYVQPFVDAVNALADSNIESVTAEGTVVTVVFKTAVDSFTATMSSAQVRANYITVYEAPESTEPENPPVNPEQPVVGGGAADFNTIVTSNANGDSGYSNSYSTTNGWSITNSAIQSGGTTDSNPQFIVIGPDNTHKAVCLNGKTTAPGKITSPELSGGISKLTVKFTKIFTDTELSATVTITEVATGTTQTHVIARTLDKNEKYQVYTEEWTLETPVTGAFTMEIVNNSPTGQTTNKDRMTILSIEWEGAAPAAPAITSETFTMADYKVDGELGGGEATRTLGELLTCKLSSGWFTTEARICKNEHMILSSTESMASVVLNAGYKDSTFNVYVSADGETWTEHQMGVAYVSGYGDVTIELPAGCKFVKFDAPNAQVRIKTITVNYG